ncbi:GNAT family N-acetyltransferase [Dactylosporangium sp. CS-033363]|uniref:GNAT family N-acetyltransferase n=1 Tax=Dactylosporangium sp. CS-033363 TaxID=3239935 RepID=UPI003D92BC73
MTALEQELFGSSCYPYSVLRQVVDTFGSGLRVAVRDDAIVGYSLTMVAEEPYTAWLWSMGVHPAHRREGIGTALVAGVLEGMQRAGVKRLLLTVDPANEVAVALYAAFDFRIVSATDGYFGPGEDRLVMERSC